ncbi:hypothetical protein EON65_36220 [archaeon]|nr:MAG: hypothetical protein EON65_36220 [archaeon]
MLYYVLHLFRNEEYFHLDGSVRPQFVAYLHSQENKLSAIISQIAHTRALRRLKECMSIAYKHYLQGKAQERHIEWHQQDLLDRKQGYEEKLSAHHRLVEGALVVDQKWKLVDKHSDLKALQKRLNFASMQKHQGYTEFKPASKQRKHSKSWQLHEYDEDGLPLTADAARKEFGHEVEFELVDEAPDIEQWKHEANDIASMLKRKREAQRRRERRQELQKFEELKDYVRERTVVLDRHQKQMERIAAQVETDRLAKRAAEREVRKQERYAKYLEQERYMMQEEDKRSGEMRFHGFEKKREEFERIRMYDEEMEQCEVDRFWGIDYYENMMAQEEQRLRKFYEDRVKYKNEQLVIMKSITSFKAPKFTTFGTLPEDHMYESSQERRLAVIRKLKAEEIRSDLKYRLPYIYSGHGKKKEARKNV